MAGHWIIIIVLYWVILLLQKIVIKKCGVLNVKLLLAGILVKLLLVDIHNPHYYNYLQQTGGAANNTPRNPGDIVCGGLIPYYTMNSFVRFIARFNSAGWCITRKKFICYENFISENIKNVQK